MTRPPDEAQTDPEPGTRLGRRARSLAYVMVFLAGATAAFVGDKGYLDLRRLRAEEARAAEELEAYRAQIDAERQAVARLESGTLTRERLAREKLGLVAPGEVLILLSDDPRARTAPREPLQLHPADGGR